MDYWNHAISAISVKIMDKKHINFRDVNTIIVGTKSSTIISAVMTTNMLHMRLGVSYLEKDSLSCPDVVSDCVYAVLCVCNTSGRSRIDRR